MKTWTILILTLCIGSLCNVSGQTSVLINGDFERPASEFPNSWQYQDDFGQTVNGSFHLNNSPSPFTTYYPQGQTSFSVTDQAENGLNPIYGYPILRQQFAAMPDGCLFSFDFRFLDSAPADAWIISLKDNAGRNLFSCTIGAPSGDLHIGSMTTSLDPVVWYNVQGVIDLATKTVNGFVTPFQQAPISFSLSVNPNATGVTTFQLGDDGAGGGLAGHLYLDNVFVAPVPEPSSLALFAVGGALLAGWKLRRRLARLS